MDRPKGQNAVNPQDRPSEKRGLPPRLATPWRRVLGVAAGAAILWSGGQGLRAEVPAVRTRVPLNDHWQFIHDDPADVAGKLAYPVVKAAVEAMGADLAEPSTAPVAAALPALPGEHPGEDVSYVLPGFDDHGWRTLDLPHDWGIEGPFRQEYPGDTGKLPWWGVGWYRKHFSVSKADAGGRVFLQLDGAMSYSMVWLNGHFVGGWPYGYASYQVDLTPYLVPGGENVLAVRLDNPKGSSRWYPGGGIYRHVWLVKTGAVHVAEHGTYVTTPNVSAGMAAEVDLRVSIDNQSAADLPVTREHAVGRVAAGWFGRRGRHQTRVGSRAVRRWQAAVRRREKSSFAQPEAVGPENSPSLRRHHDPRCEPAARCWTATRRPSACARSALIPTPVSSSTASTSRSTACATTATSARSARPSTPARCNASSKSSGTWAATPSAPATIRPRRSCSICATRWGCSSWTRRSTAGLLARNKNDYNVLFPDWHAKDLRALVRRDRNHPCVILWSIGNEIPEQWNSGINIWCTNWPTSSTARTRRAP